MLSVAGGICTAAGAVAEIRELPVPAATIYPKTIITAEHLVARSFRTTRLSIRGIAIDENELIGRQARRRLVAGRPISLSAVDIATAVTRGARVSLTFAVEGMSITASMIALQDGRAGDLIDVRNPASGATIRAIVNADGTLQVEGQ